MDLRADIGALDIMMYVYTPAPKKKEVYCFTYVCLSICLSSGNYLNKENIGLSVVKSPILWKILVRQSMTVDNVRAASHHFGDKVWARLGSFSAANSKPLYFK